MEKCDLESFFQDFKSSLCDKLINLTNPYLDKVIRSFSYYLFIKQNCDSDSLSIINETTTNIIFISEYIDDDNKYQLGSDFFVICIEKTLIFVNQTKIQQFCHFFTKNQKVAIYFQSNEVQSKIEQMLNLRFKSSNERFFSREELSSFTREFVVKIKNKTTSEMKKIVNFFLIIIDSVSNYLLTKAYIKSNDYDRVVHFYDYYKDIEEKMINKNEYIVLRELENINSVCIIYHIELEQLFALKSYFDENIELLFEREHLNYIEIQHPLFPRYFGLAQYYSYKAIVIEFIHGKSLDKINMKNLSNESKIKIIFQLLIGIGYLHRDGFIYRDLKPDNIFIIDGKDSIFIIDFDRMINEDMEYKFTKDFQKNEFMAPELLVNDSFSNKVDIYSIGKIINYVFSDEVFINSEHKLLKEVVTKCTMQNDIERPDILQLIEYFYINFFSKTSKVDESDIIIKHKENMLYFTFLFLISENNHPESQYNLGILYKSGEFTSNQSFNKAIQYFTLAANQNHIEAQYKLGIIYNNGKFIKQDINKAIQYFTLAANQNHIEAQCKLGLIYYEEFTARDINKAIYYFTLAACQNHVESQYNLGIIYNNGKFIKQDINKAIYYFTLAARQNFIEAQFNLGVIYYDGKFIERDINKVIYYFTLAANQNDVKSQFNLGKIYDDEKSIVHDINKAIYYYTLAANQNEVKSQYLLGVIYYNGEFPIERNIDKAIYYFTNAANQNYIEAQYVLGIIYYNEEFIERDINKTIYYFTLAADNNDINSQYNLGIIYDDENSIMHDINKAIYYFTLAANQNCIKAQHNLGVIYKDGKFTARDINKSIYYFTLAANQNYVKAQYNLGLIYIDENINVHDIRKAIYYFTLAANQNDAKSQFYLGSIYYYGEFIKRDINKAIYYFTLAANQNDTNALCHLGLFYYDCKFINRDINKVIYYFSRAANQNNERAQFCLGILYLDEDINKAIYYLNLAANQNYQDAQYILGMIYEQGKYVPKNINKSFQYYSQAANNNNPYGLLKVGLAYLNDNYLSRNINKAISYLILALNGHCIEANYFLGCIYFEGIGIDKDIDKAIKYFKEGSSFNDNRCKNNLGIIYKNIKKNEVAIEYFEEAIRQNNDRVAMYNLGHVYLFDEFINIDIDKSIELLIKSSNKDFIPSQYLLSLVIFNKLSNSINIENISNELDKHGNKSLELKNIVFDIINSLHLETYYQLLYSKMEKTEYFYDYKHDIINYWKIVSNEFEKNIKKNQKNNLTQDFYDGFGLQFKQ